MSDSEKPVLQAEGVVVFANSDAGLQLEMHLPKLQPGEQPDMHNPAHHMIAWLAQNWESFDQMFRIAFTKFKEAEAAKDADGIEDAKIIEPQGLKLVAADGESLLQH